MQAAATAVGPGVCLRVSRVHAAPLPSSSPLSSSSTACSSSFTGAQLKAHNPAALRWLQKGRGNAAVLAAASAAAGEWEAVIGVETHVQVSTVSKAFCSCAAGFGAAVNGDVCPACLGLPGSLPRLNASLLSAGLRVSLALGCTVAPTTRFARKHYFYADLPKGYQITQSDTPLGHEGRLRITLPAEVGGEQRVVGIVRCHLEEDAGKLLHQGSAAGALSGSSHSLADYNRAGVALLEIVSEPDLRSGVEAAEYGAEIRRIVRYLGVSAGDMSQGSLRCDVNVSVHWPGTPLGTKVEIKNMNSFSGMQRAADFEIARQIALHEAGRGQEIVNETRLWDEAGQKTITMRKKEGLADYRYFPEPDLPEVRITDAVLANERSTLPELPDERRQRYLDLGLPLADALLLADEATNALFFDTACSAGAEPKAVANWMMGDITKFLKEEKLSIAEIALKPETLAELLHLIQKGTISGKIAKELLPELLRTGGSAAELVEAKGLSQISDVDALAKIIDEVVNSNPKQLEQYRSGRTKVRGFFVGQIMQKSGGRADPELTQKLLTQKLDGELATASK
eukprot:jgi/Chlat1/7224/Chrsp57S06860